MHTNWLFLYKPFRIKALLWLDCLWLYPTQSASPRSVQNMCLNTSLRVSVVALASKMNCDCGFFIMSLNKNHSRPFISHAGVCVWWCCAGFDRIVSVPSCGLRTRLDIGHLNVCACTPKEGLVDLFGRDCSHYSPCLHSIGFIMYVFIYFFILPSCVHAPCIAILMFIDSAVNKNRNRIDLIQKNKSYLIKPLHASQINTVETMGSQTTLKLNSFNGVLGGISSKGHFAFDIWLLFMVITLINFFFF